MSDPSPNADFVAVLSVRVTVKGGTDPEVLADRLFEFLCSDPDDMFPEILEVEDYEASPNASEET